MMARIMRRFVATFGVIVSLAALAPLALLSIDLHGQERSRTKPGEWATYGADLASTRYSPLVQISKDNFNKLEIAWRLKTESLGPRPEFNFQATPLMVDGVVYTVAGSRRAVVALDGAT